MKVAYIESTSKGVDYHRLTKPLSLSFHELTKYNTIPLDKVDEVDADTLIFNRAMMEESQGEILAAFKTKGTKIIVDIDDYWELPQHHIAHQFYLRVFKKKIIEALTYADEVWATHQKLAQKCLKYNNRVKIYPNALDPSEAQWIPYKKESNKLRIGFVGGVTHERDLALTADAFRVAHDTMDIQAVVCGYNDKAKDIFGVYDYLMSGRYALGTDTRVIAELDQYNYGAFYDEFDVAIAPLEENEFNIHKSNLKIIEAGMKATPIIVSHTHPYVDDHPAVFKTNNWRKAFQKVNRMGKDKLKELGLSLRDYVLENYDINNHLRKL